MCREVKGSDGGILHNYTSCTTHKYINKILDTYKKMFPKENLINIKAPLEKNDHPELDNTELCNEEQITKYMCMIGQLQWAVTLVDLTS